MKENIYIRNRLIAGVVLVLAVNFIRQVYERSFGTGSNHHIYIIVYAAYMFLMVMWWRSVSREILQKQMRQLLHAQNFAMCFVFTTRLVQEVVLRNQYPNAMRITGYFIAYAVVWIPLLSFFCSLYLGRSDDDPIDPHWHMLWIPAILMLVVDTNDWHQLVARIDFIEKEGIYRFPLGPAGVAMLIWALLMIIGQTRIIHMKNGVSKSDPIYVRLLPFYEPLLLIMITIPYLISEFEELPYEPIEYTAAAIFAQVLCWKLYVLAGLIPVNSKYEDVFRGSTLSMEILDRDGREIAASENAKPVSGNMFLELQKVKHLDTDHDTQMHMTDIPDGYVLWEYDLSMSKRIFRQLQETNAELEQEAVLLARELQVQSNEVHVRLQNDIYDGLTREVETQLQLLESFLEEDEMSSELWNKTTFVGNYIKRFSNLQLTLQETGEIPWTDFEICIKDMIRGMDDLGIRAYFYSGANKNLSPQQMLEAVKALENMLEENDFALDKVEIFVRDTVEIRGEKQTIGEEARVMVWK